MRIQPIFIQIRIQFFTLIKIWIWLFDTDPDPYRSCFNLIVLVSMPAMTHQQAYVFKFWLTVTGTFIGQFTYIITVHLLYIQHSDLIWFFQFFFFLFNKTHSSNSWFSLIINYNKSLFDYCSIVVQHSDPGNEFQVFWFRNKKTLPIIIKYSRVNKHHTSTRLAYFHLGIEFCGPIATIDFSWDLQNQFLQLRLRSARQE
jgi:hypothetical protein